MISEKTQEIYFYQNAPVGERLRPPSGVCAHILDVQLPRLAGVEDVTGSIAIARHR